MSKITATEASRNWSDVLNRVHYKRESFAIERAGEIVARIEPAAHPVTTLASLAQFLSTRRVGGGFAEDLEHVVATQPSTPRDPWAF